MEILTLVKANLRHRKNNFISVFILMMIVSLILSSALSIEDNVTRRVSQANQEIGTGDLVVFIKNELLTDEIESDLRKSDCIEKIKINDTLMLFDTQINGKKGESTIYLSAYDDVKPYGIFNDDADCFISDVKPLNNGEIYLPLALKKMYSCKKDDIVSIKLNNKTIDFTIAGFMEEPFLGSDVIPIKNLFITGNDFDMLMNESKNGDTEEAITETSSVILFKMVHIYAVDEYNDKIDDLSAIINGDTKIIDHGSYSVSREDAQTYTLIISKILCGVIYLFLILLTVVIVMVLSNNVGTGIEMEYVNIGILKSQGFSKGKIRLVLLVQYLLPAMTGTATGLLLSFISVRFLSRVFITASCLLVPDDILFWKSVAVLLVIMVLLGLFIYVKTAKVSKVSPVKAIGAAGKDVNFLSIIQIPVLSRSKSLIGIRLALRQLSTNIRQYAGVCFILAFLICYLSTCYAFKEKFTETYYDEMYGTVTADVCVEYNDHINMRTEVEKKISEITHVSGSYAYSEVSFFMDDISYTAQVIDDSSYLKNITDGKKSESYNEILITNYLSNKINKSVGDNVVIESGDNSREFIICGTYDGIGSAGNTFAFTFDAARTIDSKLEPSTVRYITDDDSKTKQINEMINHEYGDNGIKTVNSKNQSASTISTVMDAVNGMILFLFLVAVIFTVIVIWMMCTKSFIRERMSIGIYKANGFSTWSLKMQFCMRYLFVTFAASILGEILYILFGDAINTTTLMSIGITEFDAPVTPVSILIPLLIIYLSVFSASYITLRKINKVSTSELIVE